MVSKEITCKGQKKHSRQILNNNKRHMKTPRRKELGTFEGLKITQLVWTFGIKAERNFD